MRKIEINAIKGSESLAKDVYSANDTILLPAGTLLRKEYIEPLSKMDIRYIYVEDELSVGIEESSNSENELKDQCLKKVRETISHISFNMNDQISQINRVAEDVIVEVLENKNVIYNIAGVRQKSESIYSHSLSVCALSVLLAIKLNLSREKIMDIAVGSILHDIGFICVEVNLNDHQNKEYSLEELTEIKKHVIYGYNLVEQADWMSPVAKKIILHHHERCNGSGYPFRLNGDKLNIGSKIVAVCDEFDNMVYGAFTPKRKVYQAIEYIVSQSSIKFSAQVVKAFNDSVAAYPNGTIVMTNEKELGIVLRQNNNCPTRPVLRIIQDRDGNKCEEWIEKNMIVCKTLFIVDTVESL